jgi:hypothetical protein
LDLQHWKVENCLELLDTAYKYNLKRLKQLATELLFPNVRQAVEAIKNKPLDSIDNIPQDVRELLLLGIQL